jgi:V/A-type H+-transporting ATPase subunit K
MMGLELIPAFVSIVLQEGSQGGPAITAAAAGAISVGLAGLGAGIAERGIGAAAMGAIAEDEDLFGTGIILTVLPETIVILAIVGLIIAAVI